MSQQDSPKFTVDQMMAFRPCYSRERVQELWGRRKARYHAELDANFALKIELARLSGTVGRVMALVPQLRKQAAETRALAADEVDPIRTAYYHEADETERNADAIAAALAEKE